MKKLLIAMLLMLLAAVPLRGQTHVFCPLDGNCHYTGSVQIDNLTAGNLSFADVTFAGPVKLQETTAPVGATGYDIIWGDSTAHRIKVLFNNGSATTLAAYTDNLGMFAPTTSAQLLAVISDPTGTGSLVFGTSPTLTTPNIATIVNTGTLTLPTSTDTLTGRNTTDTLTNKTIDTAGPNTIKVAGTSLTSVTGSGAVVLATAPTLSDAISSGFLVGTALQPVTVEGGAGATIDFLVNSVGNLTTLFQVADTGNVTLVKGGASLSLSGGTSGTTAMVASGVASGTITVPAATDQLVGRSTTDTLSNKTIDTAAPNTIKINGNTLSASAGTATVTVPNSTDQLVGRATTDTLSNKTIDTAAPNTIKINGNTLSATAGTATVTIPNSTDTLVNLTGSQSLTNKTFDCTSNLGMVRLAPTVTLGSASATITFSSITGTCKHLIVELQGRSAAALAVDNIVLQFNGDSAANYDQESLAANNITASANSSSGASNISIGVVPAANATRPNAAGVTVIDIPNYSGTTFEKTVIGHSVSTDSTVANQFTVVRGGSWRNTAAITSITLSLSSGGNFVIGTTATLYGGN